MKFHLSQKENYQDLFIFNILFITKTKWRNMRDINKLFLNKQAQIFAPTINRPIMLSQENFAVVSLFA